jgi:hypothetical protein
MGPATSRARHTDCDVGDGRSQAAIWQENRGIKGSSTIVPGGFELNEFKKLRATFQQLQSGNVGEGHIGLLSVDVLQSRGKVAFDAKRRSLEWPAFTADQFRIGSLPQKQQMWRLRR